MTEFCYCLCWESVGNLFNKARKYALKKQANTHFNDEYFQIALIFNEIILLKTRKNTLDPVVKAYIKKLRSLRAESSITQEAIAETLGCDYTTYGKIERGAGTLTVGRAIRLAMLFNVSLEELLNLSELRKDPEFNSLSKGLDEPPILREPKSEYGKAKPSKESEGLHLHISIGDTSKNDPKANEFMENLTALMKSIKPEELE